MQRLLPHQPVSLRHLAPGRSALYPRTRPHILALCSQDNLWRFNHYMQGMCTSHNEIVDTLLTVWSILCSRHKTHEAHSRRASAAANMSLLTKLGQDIAGLSHLDTSLFLSMHLTCVHQGQGCLPSAL